MIDASDFLSPLFFSSIPSGRFDIYIAFVLSKTYEALLHLYSADDADEDGDDDGDKIYCQDKKWSIIKKHKTKLQEKRPRPCPAWSTRHIRALFGALTAPSRTNSAPPGGAGGTCSGGPESRSSHECALHGMR